MLLQHAGRGGERLNLAREKTGHRRSGAAVGDVDQFDPGLCREHLHGHMQGAIGAGRPIRDGVRAFLGILD